MRSRIAALTSILILLTMVSVAETISIFTGQSQLLTTRSLKRTAISDPAVCEVIVISDTQLLINGKRPGEASLHLWDGRGLSSYKVKVADDTQSLAKKAQAAIGGSGILIEPADGALIIRGTVATGDDAKRLIEATKVFYPHVISFLTVGGGSWIQLSDLEEALANPKIRVHSLGETLVLEGQVASYQERERAEKLAQYAASKVLNLLVVPSRSGQVLLQVQAVELSRQGAQKLGIELYGSTASGAMEVGTQTFSYLPGGPFVELSAFLAQIQALEESGDAKILAQPSLLVEAGQEATFLAGGEIPVGVPEQDKVTVFWKEYGVKLKMLPQIIGEDQLSIALEPEVSTLDWENGIKLNGALLPGLKTRRTQTKVSMSPGSTLVISGLLYQEEVEKINKVPLLGDIPILGLLFRSRAYQMRQSELVFLVTPTIVAGGSSPTVGELLESKEVRLPGEAVR